MTKNTTSTDEGYKRLLEKMRAIPEEKSTTRPSRLPRKFTKEQKARFRILRAIKQVVLRRDNDRCVICGYHFSVEVHHIVPVAKGGVDHVNNMVTLCPNHHRMAHKGIITSETLRRYIDFDAPEDGTLDLYDYSKAVKVQ